MWCIAKLTKEYRKHMYRILDLYLRPYDAKNPTICVDEKSKQLMSDTRVPIAMKPGKPEKIDYEYKRNGTRNIFAAVEPLAGNHIIKVTKRRRKPDFAIFIKELVTKAYKTAEKINIVCAITNNQEEPISNINLCISAQCKKIDLKNKATEEISLRLKNHLMKLFLKMKQIKSYGKSISIIPQSMRVG